MAASRFSRLQEPRPARVSDVGSQDEADPTELLTKLGRRCGEVTVTSSIASLMQRSQLKLATSPTPLGAAEVAPAPTERDASASSVERSNVQSAAMDESSIGACLLGQVYLLRAITALQPPKDAAVDIHNGRAVVDMVAAELVLPPALLKAHLAWPAQAQVDDHSLELWQTAALQLACAYSDVRENTSATQVDITHDLLLEHIRDKMLPLASIKRPDDSVLLELQPLLHTAECYLRLRGSPLVVHIAMRLCGEALSRVLIMLRNLARIGQAGRQAYNLMLAFLSLSTEMMTQVQAAAASNPAFARSLAGLLLQSSDAPLLAHEYAKVMLLSPDYERSVGRATAAAQQRAIWRYFAELMRVVALLPREEAVAADAPPLRLPALVGASSGEWSPGGGTSRSGSCLILSNRSGGGSLVSSPFMSPRASSISFNSVSINIDTARQNLPSVAEVLKDLMVLMEPNVGLAPRHLEALAAAETPLDDVLTAVLDFCSAAFAIPNSPFAHAKQVSDYFVHYHFINFLRLSDASSALEPARASQCIAHIKGLRAIASCKAPATKHSLQHLSVMDYLAWQLQLESTGGHHFAASTAASSSTSMGASPQLLSPNLPGSGLNTQRVLSDPSPRLKPSRPMTILDRTAALSGRTPAQPLAEVAEEDSCEVVGIDPHTAAGGSHGWGSSPDEYSTKPGMASASSVGQDIDHVLPDPMRSVHHHLKDSRVPDATVVQSPFSADTLSQRHSPMSSADSSCASSPCSAAAPVAPLPQSPSAVMTPGGLPTPLRKPVIPLLNLRMASRGTPMKQPSLHDSAASAYTDSVPAIASYTADHSAGSGKGVPQLPALSASFPDPQHMPVPTAQVPHAAAPSLGRRVVRPEDIGFKFTWDLDADLERLEELEEELGVIIQIQGLGSATHTPDSAKGRQSISPLQQLGDHSLTATGSRRSAPEVHAPLGAETRQQGGSPDAFEHSSFSSTPHGCGEDAGDSTLQAELSVPCMPALVSHPVTTFRFKPDAVFLDEEEDSLASCRAHEEDGPNMAVVGLDDLLHVSRQDSQRAHLGAIDAHVRLHPRLHAKSRTSSTSSSCSDLDSEEDSDMEEDVYEEAAKPASRPGVPQLKLSAMRPAEPAPQMPGVPLLNLGAQQATTESSANGTTFTGADAAVTNGGDVASPTPSYEVARAAFLLTGSEVQPRAAVPPLRLPSMRPAPGGLFANAAGKPPQHPDVSRHTAAAPERPVLLDAQFQAGSAGRANLPHAARRPSTSSLDALPPIPRAHGDRIPLQDNLKMSAPFMMCGDLEEDVDRLMELEEQGILVPLQGLQEHDLSDGCHSPLTAAARTNSSPLSTPPRRSRPFIPPLKLQGARSLVVAPAGMTDALPEQATSASKLAEALLEGAACGEVLQHHDESSEPTPRRLSKDVRKDQGSGGKEHAAWDRPAHPGARCSADDEEPSELTPGTRPIPDDANEPEALPVASTSAQSGRPHLGSTTSPNRHTHSSRSLGGGSWTTLTPRTGRARAVLEAERQRRIVYRDLVLHAEMLALTMEVLLTSCGTLDSSFLADGGAASSSADVVMVLQHHLSDAANAVVLPVLTAVATSMGPTALRLLKLTAPSMFHGTRLTHWRPLARGAFAEIYTAQWMHPDGRMEEVAVKAVDTPAVNGYFGAPASILSEVTALEELQNTGRVARLLDYGVHGGRYMLVMQQYRCSLRTWRLRQAPGMCDRYLHILLEVLEALKVVAHANIVHFDLKCDNVLLEALPGISDDEFWQPLGTELPFRVVLADFGEALICPKGEVPRTKRARGTDAYKSPELVMLGSGIQNPQHDQHDRRKQSGAGLASDVWSLGCLAYELFTGKTLFSDGASSYPGLAVEQRIALGAPGAAVLSAEEVAALGGNQVARDVLEKALVRDASRRPPAGNMAAFLRQRLQQAE